MTGGALPARPAALIGLVLCAWLGNALYALGAPGGSLKEWSPAIVATAMIAFAVLHCLRCYGPAGVLGFVAIVFTLGWLFETVSIATGVPFGRYHYTEAMAPFVGQVPVFVMPAYGLMGYVCWSLARLIWGAHGAEPLPAAGLRVPLTAAAMMVVWDLSMDPLRATVEGRWVWVDGGWYLGVPLSNFIGWFAVTWAMFQAFAAFLARLPRPDAWPDRDARTVWTAMALMYFAFSVEYLANGLLVALGHDLGDAGAQAIYANVALVCATTMLPLTLYCVWRARSAGMVTVPQPDEETVARRREATP